MQAGASHGTLPTMGTLLVFDGDCGFCTTSARWLDDRLPPDVTVVPWQQLDLDEVGLTSEGVAASVWWIDAAGRRVGGAGAVGAALDAIGGRWRPLGWLARHRPTSWLAEPAYRLVAANRHRLPGGTPACAIPRLAPR